MPLNTVLLVSCVSQATFALTLGLLAVSDRRSRGLLWLSSAAVLHLLYTASVQAWFEHPLPALVAPGACALVLLFFCGYKGIQYFLAPGSSFRRRDRWLLALALAAVPALWLAGPAVSLVAARLVSVWWIAATLRLLFGTRMPHLRRTSQVVGLMLLGTMTCVCLRLAGDLHAYWTGVSTGRLLTGGFGLEADLILDLGLSLGSWLIMLGCMGLYVAEARQRLHVEARLDTLTGLHNRRYMEETAERELRRAAQHGLPLALLMIDADHFKQLNDTWGHALGDRALQAIAQALTQSVRPGGCVARVGGEEFAVLLPHTDALAAVQAAERLRRTIQDLRLMEGREVVPLTVSIGAGLRAEDVTTWADILRRADIALYRAKREGRNRVALAKESDAMPPLSAAPAPRPRARWMRGYSLATLEAASDREMAGAGESALLQGQTQDASGLS